MISAHGKGAKPTMKWPETTNLILIRHAPADAARVLTGGSNLAACLPDLDALPLLPPLPRMEILGSFLDRTRRSDPVDGGFADIACLPRPLDALGYAIGHTGVAGALLHAPQTVSEAALSAMHVVGLPHIIRSCTEGE